MRGERLFKNRKVLALPREEIGELFEAAKADWRQVEPAIFGTLCQSALNFDPRSARNSDPCVRDLAE